MVIVIIYIGHFFIVNGLTPADLVEHIPSLSFLPTG